MTDKNYQYEYQKGRIKNKIDLPCYFILFLSFYNFGTIFSPFRVSVQFIGDHLVVLAILITLP